MFNTNMTKKTQEYEITCDYSTMYATIMNHGGLQK